MKTRLLALNFIIGALIPGFSAVQSSTSVSAEGESLSLEFVLAEVLHKNPSLKAAQANWEAMKQRIPQARAWEDSRFGVDVERSGTTRFATFSDNEWMLSQEIPISGKNRLRGRVAAADAAGAFIELHRRQIDLSVRARAAYFRLANAFAQLDLSQKNLALWKQFVAAARTKYELGTQSQADVLVAE